MPRQAKLKNEIKKEEFGVTNFGSPLWSPLFLKRVSDDPVQDLIGDLPRWRNAARYQYETISLVKGAVESAVSVIIGKGLFCSPSPKIKDQEEALYIRTCLLEYWNDWTNHAHIDGQTDLSSTLRQIVSAIIRDGDVLTYLRLDPDNHEVAIDLIPAERIESPTNDIIRDATNSLPTRYDSYIGICVEQRKIRGYFIKDNVGSKEGYTFFPAFVNGVISSVLLKNPNNTDRINAYRGIPLLGACVNTVDQLAKLMTAELEASILKTRQFAVLKTKSVTDAKKGLVDPLSNIQSTKLGDTNLAIIPVTDELTRNTGNDISNPNIDKMVQVYLREIASAFNIPSNILFNMLDDSSYSTNSTIRQVAYESTEIWRHYITRNLLIPLYKIVMENGLTNNLIPGLANILNKYSLTDLLPVDFKGRSNIPIRSKDIYDGQQLAIATGQKSIIDACSEMGQDAYSILDTQLQYVAARKSKMAEMGLSEVDIIAAVQNTKLTMSPANPDKAPSEAKKDDSNESPSNEEEN